MKKVYTILILTFILSLFACFGAQLKEGSNVKYVTKQEAPSNCTEIAPVEVSKMKFEFAMSAPDVITMLRNKTGQLGGNFLVVEIIEKEYSNNGYAYYGSGQAYRCP